MPKFLDEFAASVGSKKDAVKQKVLNGTPNPLQNCFRERFLPFGLRLMIRADLGLTRRTLVSWLWIQACIRICFQLVAFSMWSGLWRCVEVLSRKEQPRQYCDCCSYSAFVSDRRSHDRHFFFFF